MVRVLLGGCMFAALLTGCGASAQECASLIATQKNAAREVFTWSQKADSFEEKGMFDDMVAARLKSRELAGSSSSGIKELIEKCGTDAGWEVAQYGNSLYR